MILIGEKLNSSIPSALAALDACDEGAVLNLARRQLDGGAEYLDLNTALCGDEAGAMIWAAKLILGEFDCGIMADSPNPEVISAFYDAVSPKKSIINSVTLEPERFDAILPLIKRLGCGVVAMPISQDGMPHGVEGRVANISKLINALTDEGVPYSNIYADIVAESAGADWEAPAACLTAARELRNNYPEVHLTAGLSNISFGLPERGVLNRAFLCMLAASGVDSAILDTANADMVLTVRAAEMLLGEDPFCTGYLAAYRANKK